MIRVVARAAAVAAGASLYALAMPPADWSVCAWVTLVPLLVVVRGRTARAAFGYGALYGFVSAATVTWWLVPVAATYFKTSLLIAALGMTAAYVIAVASTGGLFAMAAASLLGRAAWPATAAVVPAAWVGAELIRARLVGQPWALLGYTQHAEIGLLQVATIGGVYAVSFVVALGNVGLAEVVARWRDGHGIRPALAAALGPGIVVATVWLAGAASVPPVATEPDARTVAMVQANVPPAFTWTRAYAEQQLRANLRVSATLPRDLHPALIVWPENSLSLYLENEPMIARELGRLAATTGADVLVGAPRRDGDRTFNSVRLVRADGARGAHYDKRHLVLFAETPALGGPPPVEPGESPRAFAAGDAPGVLPSFVPLGVSICHEVLYPEIVTDPVRDGAAVLVNVANDGWLDGGLGVGSRQHVAMATFRAVEARRYLVRAATTGVSVIVDPWGRIRTTGPAGAAGVFTGTVAPRRDLTPYVRFGDGFAGACLLIAVATVARRRMRAPSFGAPRPVPVPWRMVP